MSFDIPSVGNWILGFVLITASYTLVASLWAIKKPQWLNAARYGAFATTAWVALSVSLLAYAFQTHDFRIRYVARYSDRSMSWWYLFASLWGGQDGSLLWWTVLLSLYTAACVWWLKGRYQQLAPYVIATLMSVFLFFCVVMLFAANPFATSIAGAPADGEGLNPLLQNYWMTIHPPSLYMGFVGWSVPFAFAVAALISGRLGEEWIVASRRWVLFAWAFLSLGNLLGMVWSYEELGWGGYWAWDPVENAAVLPWFSGTAFLHSVMIQERRHMLKMWNVSLLLLTFFLTIFGTFLTRSGLISSVHSFARSDIGIYFLWYLGLLAIVSVGLVVWRRKKLRADNQIDSLVSREFSFLLQNWVVLGILAFILIATVFPRISEWLRNETVTVGPAYYNKWMVPLGLLLMALMGVGPLITWRKATGSHLLRAFRWPVLVGVATAGVHIAIGNSIGFPARVAGDEIYETLTGKVLSEIYALSPMLSFALCAFVMATITQEFVRGWSVRRKNTQENPFTAMIRLVSKARRRYGGYLVHAGVVLMFIGFTGAAYDVKRETALEPGKFLSIKEFRLRYDGSRMEVDPNKRMIFADMTLFKGSEEVGKVHPAKFIYRTHPEMPTTEVAIRSRPGNDLYVIMNTIDPSSKVGTFQVIYRPLVMWVWLGGILVLLGTIVAMSPTTKEILEALSQRAGHARLGVAGTVALLLLTPAAVLTVSVAQARAQAESSSTLHAGSVEIRSPEEAKLFERMLCQCGDCARLPLNTCACSWAVDSRTQTRQQLKQGMSVGAILAAFRKEHGAKAIAVPSDQGLDRLLWAVPIAGMLAMAFAVIAIGRRWRAKQPRSTQLRSNPDTDSVTSRPSDAPTETYDQQLDQELSNLEDV